MTTEKRPTLSSFAEIRAKAEAAEAAERKRADEASEDPGSLSSAATASLLHELRVHQIELEMQNDELRRSELILDAVRQRYFDLYDMSPVGYCTVSETGLIIEANLTLSTLLGVPRALLVNKRFDRFIRQEVRDSFYQVSRRMLAREQAGREGEAPEEAPLLEPHQIVRSDGSFFWAQLTLSIGPDPGRGEKDGPVEERRHGARPALLVTLTDITALRANQAQQDLSHAALKAVAQGVLITGPDQRIVSVNAAYEAMTGYRESEIVGRTPKFVQGPDTDPATKEALRAALNRHAGFTGEILNYRKDGTPFWNELTISPVFDANGNLTHFVGVGHDVTARRQAESVRAFLSQAGTDAEPFFHTLARFLATTLDMQFVCIDRLEAGDLNAHTVAVWSDDHFEDDSSYALSDTPCGEVAEKDICCFPAHVCQLFPRDQTLKDFRAESYAGIRLVGHSGQPIGLIAAMGRKPMANRAQTEFVLELVRARAAGEMERLIAVAALSHQSELLDRTGALAQVGGWEVNLSTMKISWTRETFRIADLDPPVEPTLEEGINLFAPEARPVIAAAVQATIDAGTHFDLALPLITAKGRHLWVQTQGFAEMKNGKAIRIYGTFQDITARKQAHESLRSSEGRFRTLVEYSPYCIHEIDLEGRLTSMNRAGLAMMGLDDECLIVGLEYLDAVGCGDRERIGRLMAAALGGQASEFEFKGSNGAEFQSSFVPIVDDSGSVQRLMGLTLDITARKQAEAQQVLLEAQLRQAQALESIGRLAGGVAHDFNNMLTVILGNIELALGEQKAAGPIHADLLAVRTAAMHAGSLTRQLLAFARKQAIAPITLHLNDSLTHLLPLLRRMIREDIAFQVNTEAALWPIRMDPSQLDQVLTNLCLNAQDAISGAGQVAIATANCALDAEFSALHDGATAGEYVRLTVSDTGCGIDADTLSRIFEPFFTTKPFGQGTGLGLAMLYGIARQNGGFIAVSSRVGVGSQFEFYLPRHTSNVVSSPAPRAPQLQRGVETILLVEDQPAVMATTARALEAQGYVVIQAATPHDAIRLANAHASSIHLLLTDVVMPEMNGPELSELLLAKHPHLALMFMSGYAGIPARPKGAPDLGGAFIQKPFSMLQLAEKVRDALASSRPPRE